MTVVPWNEVEARAAHRVASKGRPYLYLASRLLDDPVQRGAFDVAYASMRLVDDAVDERLEEAAPASLRDRVLRWRETARAAHQHSGEPRTALAKLFRIYDLPLDPWENLASALLADLDRDGFQTLDDFLGYAEGAAVGPGRVFAMLVTAEFQGGRYVPHPLSRDEVFAELARFTYLVHGLRDLAEDLRGHARGSALAPRSELGEAGLSPESLLEAPLPMRCAWVLGVARRARSRREAAEARFQEILSQVPAGSAFVLAFLVRLYERQLERIEQAGGDVFGDAHRMPPSDVLEVAGVVAGERAGAPGDWSRRLESELGATVPRA